MAAVRGRPSAHRFRRAQRRVFAMGSRAFLLAVLLFALWSTACSSAADPSQTTAGDASAGSPPTSAAGEEADEEPWPDGFVPGVSTAGWRTDFTKRIVSLGEIESGGPGKDGIPAIDEPVFTSTGEADRFLAPDEPVMVVRRGADARAYPIQILIWHEIVNDVVGGDAIAVTFCPLCNTALAFERTVGGRVLDFGTTGNLRHSDLVMYDRQTETWWQQASGEAIIGEFVGTTLEPVAASIFSYADFRAAYPTGQVLSRETGHDRPYGQNPYEGYDTGDPFFFRGDVDARLRPTERVVAVVVGDEAVAYPFSRLESVRTVNDAVGGRAIAVFFKPGTRSALDAEAIRNARLVGAGVVFDRSFGGRDLTFRADGDLFRDDETGTRWDIAGRAVSGPLAGSQLESVAHGNHFWFAWAVFRPETRVYG
ncbi:MAG: DUF3179 domain-containing protein [Dehalococcoidia bacterium]